MKDKLPSTINIKLMPGTKALLEEIKPYSTSGWHGLFFEAITVLTWAVKEIEAGRLVFSCTPDGDDLTPLPNTTAISIALANGRSTAKVPQPEPERV